jgi:hypothetical protein
MGIWLHEKYREHVVWISSALFARHGNCSDTWPAVLKCTCFTRAKVQILTHENVRGR